jgi:hypothetical protein
LERIMTTTILWSGVALWLALNAAFLVWRIYVTVPETTTVPELVWTKRI